MNWIRIFATFLTFIVVIGLGTVVYELFFQDIEEKKVINQKKEIKEIVTRYSADLKPSLSEIEQSRQESIKPYQTQIKSEKKVNIERDQTVQVLTLNDLRDKFNKDQTKNHHKYKPKKNIYSTQQKDTFEVLKNILIQSSNSNLNGGNIVLNSSISSILHSQEEKDRFIQLMSQKFQLPIEVIEELSYNNGYVWDWIRELNNR